MLGDIAYALRTIRNHKGWSAVIILSLALGIGANTALFSVVDSVLLDTLDVPDPGSLVAFRWVGENNAARGSIQYGYVAQYPGAGRTGASFSYAAFGALRGAHPGIDVFTFFPQGFSEPETGTLTGQVVSGNYYEALGLPPVLGRLIVRDDDRVDAEPVIVISEAFWEERFGRDDGVIGTSLVLEDRAFTIVGVAPDAVGNLFGPDEDTPLVTMPIGAAGAASRPSVEPRNWGLPLMGRLEPGASIGQLEADLGALFDRAVRQEVLESPDQSPDVLQVPELRLRSGRRGLYDPRSDTIRNLGLLSVVFGIVLVIVCLNLANLTLARAESRRGEMGIRLAMGASPGRVVRQLLTESLVLSVIAGGIGFWIAYAAIPLLPFEKADIDPTVLGFVTALILATGFLAGMAPALRSRRAALAGVMKEHAATASRGGSLLSRSLVVTQVGLTVVLMVGAGLLLQTVWNLRSVPVGFNPDGLVVVTISSGSGLSIFGDPAAEGRVRQFYEEIRNRFSTTVGVQSVTWATQGLLTGARSGSSVFVDGQASTAPSSTANMTVDDQFFRTLEIPVRTGRDFTRRDYDSGIPVAIVNEAFVRTFFPELSPPEIVGRFLGRSRLAPPDIQIVGVVADVQYASLREERPPMVYRALRSTAPPVVSRFIVRSEEPLDTLAPTIRSVVEDIDANASVLEIQTQMSYIEQTYAPERLTAMISTAFGGLVLAVSMTGLFGLMSWSVARRTREVGIRMALGAEARRIRLSVLRQSWTLVSAGIVLGVAGSLALTRLIESRLFGLGRNDPLTFVAASLLLLAVATLAAWLPARRASQVDPLVALRHE